MAKVLLSDRIVHVTLDQRGGAQEDPALLERDLFVADLLRGHRVHHPAGHFLGLVGSFRVEKEEVLIFTLLLAHRVNLILRVQPLDLLQQLDREFFQNLQLADRHRSRRALELMDDLAVGLAANKE